MLLETKTRKKYGALSPALKRRFVAACLRRVLAARARVYPQPDKVGKEAVEATIRILGAKASDGSARITKAIKACERFADAFENELDGPQLNLMCACLAALELARGDHDDAHVVTNNIDTMIDGYDPEGEAGVEEEQTLRVRILDALARSDEDAVEALVAGALPWERRWAKSWEEG